MRLSNPLRLAYALSGLLCVVTGSSIFAGLQAAVAQMPVGVAKVDITPDELDLDRPSRFSLDVEDAIIDAVHELTPESFAKEAR